MTNSAPAPSANVDMNSGSTDTRQEHVNGVAVTGTKKRPWCVDCRKPLSHPRHRYVCQVRLPRPNE
jgi:hypothetical protein